MCTKYAIQEFNTEELNTISRSLIWKHYYTIQKFYMEAPIHWLVDLYSGPNMQANAVQLRWSKEALTTDKRRLICTRRIYTITTNKSLLIAQNKKESSSWCRWQLYCPPSSCCTYFVIFIMITSYGTKNYWNNTSNKLGHFFGYVVESSKLIHISRLWCYGLQPNT